SGYQPEYLDLPFRKAVRIGRSYGSAECWRGLFQQELMGGFPQPSLKERWKQVTIGVKHKEPGVRDASRNFQAELEWNRTITFRVHDESWSLDLRKHSAHVDSHYL